MEHEFQQKQKSHFQAKLTLSKDDQEYVGLSQGLQIVRPSILGHEII